MEKEKERDMKEAKIRENNLRIKIEKEQAERYAKRHDSTLEIFQKEISHLKSNYRKMVHDYERMADIIIKLRTIIQN